MSHGLHRMGTGENLNNDYTIVIRPEKGYNDVGSREALRAILRGLHDCGAVNISAARGEKFKGNIYMCGIEDIVDGVGEGKSLFAAFDHPDRLEKFLSFLIDGDFGLSVVVQGLCENVKKVLDKVGLRVHTANHSLGVWGKTEKLPPRGILEITTMCGHGIVAPSLVEDVVRKVKKGDMTLKEGAVVLSKPCICGIFNTTRAKNLLEGLIR